MTYKLPRRTLFLWQLRCLFAVMVLFCLLAWLSLPIKLLLMIIGIVLAAAAGVAFLYLPARFRSFSLTVNEDSLQMKQGVFIVTERLMPKKRMVYAEQHETPLMSAMSLSALSLRAARGALFTPELDRADAACILENLR